MAKDLASILADILASVHSGYLFYYNDYNQHNHCRGGKISLGSKYSVTFVSFRSKSYNISYISSHISTPGKMAPSVKLQKIQSLDLEKTLSSCLVVEHRYLALRNCACCSEHVALIKSTKGKSTFVYTEQGFRLDWRFLRLWLQDPLQQPGRHQNGRNARYGHITSSAIRSSFPSTFL